MVEPTAPTAGPSLTDVPESSESTSKALQDIATRLRALDDYATDKWDGLDQLLDQKNRNPCCVNSKSPRTAYKLKFKRKQRSWGENNPHGATFDADDELEW